MPSTQLLNGDDATTNGNLSQCPQRVQNYGDVNNLLEERAFYRLKVSK